ncbi:hypothetical protein [Rhodococcus oxybenzonivorans]|uniref:hypothetical protein n=1 Tax=Rhodococcus TaxID=1827 RepID=UPI0037C90E37
MFSHRSTATGGPILHSCVLACVRNLSLFSVAFVPHGISPIHDGFQVASLDPAVRFHRPPRMDDWL